MIKAIAVDDEPPALEILENYCRRTEKVELMKVFTSTSERWSTWSNFRRT